MPQELSAADKSLVVSDPTGSLEFYNTAIVAINKAATVDEVREIRDKAAAHQAYAKQVENRVFEKQAAIIRMRAEVKGGQLFEAVAIKAGVRRGSSVIGL